MKNKIKTASFVVLVSLASHNVYADYFKNFTTPVVKNLVSDYGVDNYDHNDDSKLLQKAIDELSKNGGGQIIIPEGVYYFINIEMKSNIKISIDQGASIRPYLNGMFKKGVTGIFNVDENNTEVVKNIIVTSLQKDKRFTVELPVIREVSGNVPDNKFRNVYGIRVFHYFNVENFEISNMNVYDSKTKYSAISLNPITKDTFRGHEPTTGDIKNISVFNAHYGYGGIQVQGANHVNFENIESEGGAALRLETGYVVMNDLQIGGVKNIKAKNIKCINGSAALTLSPHSMQTNENIDAQDIKSDGCNFAVRIAAGYVASKQKNKELKPGRFQNVNINGVDATFGMHSQILHKDFTFLPKDQQRYIYQANTDEVHLVGPSIAAVGYVAGRGEKQNYNVSIKDINMHGFKFNTKAIINTNDRYELYTKEK